MLLEKPDPDGYIRAVQQLELVFTSARTVETITLPNPDGFVDSAIVFYKKGKKFLLHLKKCASSAISILINFKHSQKL